MRDAAETLLSALNETVAALEPPAQDAALVRLAAITAETIDAMPDGQRGMMLGQTAPLLLKLLQELDVRAQRRHAKAGAGRPNRVAQLRAAHATATAKRGQAG